MDTGINDDFSHLVLSLPRCFPVYTSIPECVYVYNQKCLFAPNVQTQSRLSVCGGSSGGGGGGGGLCPHVLVPVHVLVGFP